MYRYGFTEEGDFIALDPTTRAAVRAYRHSDYWRCARQRGTDVAAATAIRDTLKLRVELPDLPSHQPEAWEHNYTTLAALLPQQEERAA